MLEALSTPHNRRVMLILFLVCCATGMAAGAMGISDNPPALLLALLSCASLVLAFVHPWRTTRQFGLLLFASSLGFVIFVILHNGSEALDTRLAAAGVLHVVLQGIGFASFLLAVLVCPPAMAVGAAGTAAMFIRSRLRAKPALGAAAGHSPPPSPPLTP